MYTVADHVLIQSAHHTHCISFNTNPCTCVSFSISISLQFHASFCFLPTVIVSTSFYELQIAYIAENYLISHLYPLYICFVICKVIVEIYYFVILKQSTNIYDDWVCNTYGRDVHFNNALIEMDVPACTNHACLETDDQQSIFLM